MEIKQTNWTPPPNYVADEDALEPDISPIEVLGEGADLSKRSE